LRKYYLGYTSKDYNDRQQQPPFFFFFFLSSSETEGLNESRPSTFKAPLAPPIFPGRLIAEVPCS
jgi:hypothetical protein